MTEKGRVTDEERRCSEKRKGEGLVFDEVTNSQPRRSEFAHAVFRLQSQRHKIGTDGVNIEATKEGWLDTKAKQGDTKKEGAAKSGREKSKENTSRNK